MRILGIETTCDETGAAVVEDGPSTSSGFKVLSNVVASSVDLQKKYGGVVPEVAAREQVRVIIPVIREVLEQAAEVGGWKLEAGRGNEMWDKKSHFKLQNPASHLSNLTSNIDAIAIAHGPGLVGSLLIGVETAKALAIAWKRPLIPVNHLVGHIYANWLDPLGVNSELLMVNRGTRESIHDSRFTINFPLVALIVSGGHTDLVLMRKHGDFKLLGSTLDDAAGEAFDKVAKLLGLGYPGGPEIERLALSVQRSALSVKLPRPMIGSKDFDFSFSGLKTAVVNLVSQSYSSSERSESRSSINKGGSPQGRTIDNVFKSAIAAEFQQAVVDVLVRKTIAAAQKFGAKTIVVGGGVAANLVLRTEIIDHSKKIGIPAFFPSKKLAIDNGAMIAAAAFFNFKKVDPLKLSADPALHF